MKVFCIDSSNSGSIIKLEIGEWYEVIRDADENSYYIKQNNTNRTKKTLLRVNESA